MMIIAVIETMMIFICKIYMHMQCYAIWILEVVNTIFILMSN